MNTQNHLPRLYRLGLTGNIGAGKSTVAALLRERGLVVLDADEQARLVTQEPDTLAQLAAAFPGTVKGGVLDRAALAGEAFVTPEATARLNAIVHPRVRARMQAQEAEAVALGARWVVQDIPLLFETGQESSFDAVLLVDAPLETRVQRVMERSGLTREEILARDSKQMPAAEKRQRATYIIDNSQSLNELGIQLDRILAKLMKETP